MSTQPDSGFTSSHDSLIQDPFSRQAELFARSPELHGEWKLGDVYRLPFADGSFDIVS